MQLLLGNELLLGFVAVEFGELFCLRTQTIIMLRYYDNAHLCDAAAGRRALSPVMVLK